MKKSLVLTVALGASTLVAGPAVKMDPVAPGFPVWTGVTAKNHICGRELTPSDLRHKVTILLEVDVTDKLQEHLILAGGLMGRATVQAPESGMDLWQMPRTYVAVVSCHGSKDKAKIEEALVLKKKDDALSAKMRAYGRTPTSCPIYSEVSYEGAEDSTGKRPYVCVFGPTGAEPVYKGTLTADSLKEAMAAVAKATKEVQGAEKPWKPFFGNISEPKYNTTLKKVLDKGKAAKKAPLDPVSKALLTDVKSKDEEKAKEAQVLFDAIAQTRDDLILKIGLEVGGSPQCAYADMQTLLKYWPQEAKRVEAAAARLKGIPAVESMGKAYVKMLAWSDPDFTCKTSEAKKIVVDLGKIKKSLAALKESENITVQNVALLLDMKAEELIQVFKSKAEVK